MPAITTARVRMPDFNEHRVSMHIILRDGVPIGFVKRIGPFPWRALDTRQNEIGNPPERFEEKQDAIMVVAAQAR